MRVITPGHKYELKGFEIESNTQEIQFIEKTKAQDSSELITINDGTTNEEVLEMLIDRMNFLQGSFACRENEFVITKLEEALLWLNKRTSDRVKRNVEGKHLV